VDYFLQFSKFYLEKLILVY